MYSNTLRRALVAASCGASLAAGLPAVAGDWQFNPRVEIGGLTDSNYRLNLPGLGYSVAGGFGDVQLQFRDAGQVDDLSVTPGVHATYFSNSRSDNATDPSLNLDYAHHGLTSTFGLVGLYSKESVVRTDVASTEVIGGGLGNPGTGDSGYLTIRDRQQTTLLTPSLSFDLTQRTRLLFGADYTNLKYDREYPGYYVGYTNVDGSIGAAHDISQRDTLTLRVRYAQYKPNGAFAATDSTGLDGQWDHHVSQIAQAYLRVGAQRTTFGSQPGTIRLASVTSAVAGGGINWAFQVTKLFLDLTRSVDPNATGYSVVRDQVRLRVERSLTQKFTVIAGARGMHDTATGNAPLFHTRKYATGSVGFHWRYLRSWTLAGEYDYAWQRYQADPAAAVSNAGTLSIVYQPNLRE